MALLYWSHQRLAVVTGSVSMRIGDVTNLLGSGRDGSIYAADRRLCRSPRCCGWRGIMQDVQSSHSYADPAKYLSSDHDPLYRFQPWQANLRVLEIQEIKTVPYVPLSHDYVSHCTSWVRCDTTSLASRRSDNF